MAHTEIDIEIAIINPHNAEVSLPGIKNGEVELLVNSTVDKPLLTTIHGIASINGHHYGITDTVTNRNLINTDDEHESILSIISTGNVKTWVSLLHQYDETVSSLDNLTAKLSEYTTDEQYW